MSLKEQMAAAINAGEDPGTRPGMPKQKEVYVPKESKREFVERTPSPAPAPAVKPQLAQPSYSTASKVDRNTIDVILSLNVILNQYDVNTQLMLAQFMGAGEGAGSVIYQALHADPAQVEALDAISKCKLMRSAERAFFLVASSNSLLRGIIEQLESIKGLPEGTPALSDRNKIDVCKVLESTISDIQEDEMDIINKITSFLLATKGEMSD